MVTLEEAVIYLHKVRFNALEQMRISSDSHDIQRYNVYRNAFDVVTLCIDLINEKRKI